MSSGLAISMFLPRITSGSIFSTRRVNTGISADNPFVAAMNMDVASGQAMNAAKGVANIAKESKNTAFSGITSAEEAIKSMAKTDKIINGIGKVVNFTADNINPLICATSAVKVLCSDDKEDSLIRESLALGTMFSSEAIAKRVLGMPKTEKNKITGKSEVVAREGWIHKNHFADKQISALKDYCSTKKLFNKVSLKYLPGTLKGLGFVLASIGGYKAGVWAGNQLLGGNVDSRTY